MVRAGTDDHPFDIEIRNAFNEPLREYPIPGATPRARYPIKSSPYFTAHQHIYLEAPPPNRPQNYSILVQPLRTFNYNETFGYYFFPTFDGIRSAYGKKITKDSLQRVKFDSLARERLLDGTTSATRAYLKEREVDGGRVHFSASGEGSIRIAWVEIMDEAQAKHGSKGISAKAHRNTGYSKGKKKDYSKGGMIEELGAALSDSDNEGDVIPMDYRAAAMYLIDNMEPYKRATSTTSNFSGPGRTISSMTTTVTNGRTTTMTTTTTTTTTSGNTTPTRPKLPRSGTSKLRLWIETTMDELDPHYTHPPAVPFPVTYSEEIAAKQAIANRRTEVVETDSTDDEHNSKLPTPQPKQLRSVTFHYRTRETLQRLGIVPVSSPHPRPAVTRASSSAYKTYLRENEAGCTPNGTKSESCINVACIPEDAEDKVETPRESMPEFGRRSFETAAKNFQTINVRPPRLWIWDRDEDTLHHNWAGTDGRMWER
ncbi:hypothetical protein BJ508DRAFT_357175 [Ascobolus immersus RN42]|uniref:Uncharacterized protein n=1 Tax=Ascobolus immersus RN42 TaxID=1160509 RepID=A0A3N4IN27_ASCIM|nr:hypothetical protein BJ508DRAFT_357175 [Ascobolus immersus RN42]